MIKRRLVSYLFFLVVFVWVDTSAAQNTRISIAYSALSPPLTNLWISQEARLFEKYGLDVNLVLVNGGLRTIQSLIAGDVVFAGGGGESSLVANLQGADTTIIATNEPVLTYKLVGKKIRTLGELKQAGTGIKVGIQSFGSTSDFIARKILASLGLTVGKEITLLPTGDATGRLALLSQGTIDLTVMQTALPTRMSRGGFSILLDTSTSKPPFPYHGMGVVTRSEFIRRNRGIATSMMKAYIEGIKVFKTDQDFALKVRAKYTRRSNFDELREEWKEYVDVIPRVPYPTVEGIKAMLGDLRDRFPEADRIDIRRFYDESFVRELDKSSFINALYKSSPK